MRNTSDTPVEEILKIHGYFADPKHAPRLFFASDKTCYVWQHMCGRFPTDQVLRNGPIRELPERLDSAIGSIRVVFSDGSERSVDQHFETSTMDAMLVLRRGDIVFERYKTMRPYDKHNWFSCSKTIVGTLLALLEHEGKVNVIRFVPQYLPELAGSVWDTVTVEETLDMATGLDSTEHEEQDARTKPARGWFKWAVSIGLFVVPRSNSQSPVEVLRAMKRTKPGHTVFEYNSINTYVLQRIVERITKMPIAELYRERVWRQIGAQADGYLCLDREGHAMGFGSMNSTLRDFGRHGMIYTASAKKYSHDSIVPDSVIRTFQTGLRPQMYSKGSFGHPFQEALKIPG